jgi:two-component system OmpR family sensor kinase
MSRRLGLRSRVVVGSVLVLAFGITAIGVAINVLLTNRLTADAAGVLRARAEAQAGAVVDVDGRAVVRDTDADAALDRETWVFAADGTEVTRPATTADADAAARGLTATGTRATRDVGGGVRLLAVPIRNAAGRRYATVVVGLSLEPYEQSERSARLGTLILGLFVVLAGALIAWRSVGAGLRPVAEMARVAEDYGAHDLSARFGLGPPRDELTALAATLDGLLGRLEASLQHEQRLSAEIAHELRTPLSGVRAEAELALLTDEPEAVRDALGSVIDGADRMTRVIDALLRASRHRSPEVATCAIGDAVDEALAAVGGLAGESAVALKRSSNGRDLRVGAEAAYVAQALNPLLENAIRHATSTVSVAVAKSGPTIRLTITDDGPGIPPAAVGEVFEPGVSSTAGAGLGLALARRLTRSIGGDVRVEDTAPGASLVVELPALPGATV